MQKFCGHAYKIIDKVSSFYPGYVNYRLALGDETCEWVFSDIMLEPVQCLGDLYAREKLKVGDCLCKTQPSSQWDRSEVPRKSL